MENQSCCRAITVNDFLPSVLPLMENMNMFLNQSYPLRLSKYNLTKSFEDGSVSNFSTIDLRSLRAGPYPRHMKKNLIVAEYAMPRITVQWTTTGEQYRCRYTLEAQPTSLTFSFIFKRDPCYITFEDPILRKIRLVNISVEQVYSHNYPLDVLLDKLSFGGKRNNNNEQPEWMKPLSALSSSSSLLSSSSDGDDENSDDDGSCPATTLPEKLYWKLNSKQLELIINTELETQNMLLGKFEKEFCDLAANFQKRHGKIKF